jgi:diacylglycerol kinase (ATP)
MTTWILANPAAGSLDDRERLTGAVAAAGLADAEVRFIGEGGGPAELVREALAGGAATLVAAGGDGTLNRVLNALAPDFDRCRLGLLPLGTDNDFARTLGVPADLEGALAVLATGGSRRLDLVRASAADGARYLINTSAGGFSHRVGEAMEPEIKRAWGPLAYMRSAAGAIPELGPFRVRAEVDGEPLRFAAYAVVVANGRFVASGIPVAPRARLDDGLVDLVAFAAVPLAEVAVLTPKTLLGLHLDDERVTFRQARRIAVDAEPEMQFNLDGEPFGPTPVSFEVVAGAVEMVVGPGLDGDQPA